jgi:hypothetical protein
MVFQNRKERAEKQNVCLVNKGEEKRFEKYKVTCFRQDLVGYKLFRR